MSGLRALALSALAAALTACVTESIEEPATKASPEEAAIANLQLGAQYLRQGDLEAALNKLQKAVDQNPQLPQAHSALALAFERMGMGDEADRHYRQAVRLGRDDGPISNSYGAYLCRKGDYKDAEKYFLKAARNPRYRTPEAAYANAGVCALRSDDYDRAEDFFREALAINPTYVDALWQMAELSFKRDRALQSRAFLQRLAEATRLPPNALWLGMQVEKQLGDAAAAAGYARRLKTDFPDSRETGMLLELERNGG